MKYKPLLLHSGFLVIFILVMTGTFLKSPWLNYPIKPLIMIWIAISFLVLARPAPFRNLVLLAFFFSWCGDILLMQAGSNEMLFYAGVGGFFLSQLTYVFVFLRFGTRRGKGLITQKPAVLIPYVLYYAGMMAFLVPSLKGIMLPIVAVYAMAILAMSIAAANRYGLVPAGSFRYTFYGSVLFLLSDSILAINRFAAEIPYQEPLVMSTYMAAQYLIMIGLVASVKPSASNRQ